ncbi:MAG: hypothetical protein DSZ32_01190 [Gammaproteobacteria bacterium]|nr:MAG: hypothetical protein DSZ33_05080 [Gammaproteobacteria bacterium]RTZ61877.1 MAG: hypothetical protein DSZ32_01190 [Gammaproteobacteria bacterium]
MIKKLTTVSVLFWAIILLMGAPVRAADVAPDVWLSGTTHQVEQIEKKLGLVKLSQDDVDQDVKLLAQIQARAQKCVDGGKRKMADAQRNLEALGDPVMGEPPDVTGKREELKKQVNDLKNRINACQLLLIQGSDLANKLKQRISRQVKTRLFDHGTNLVAVIKGFVTHPAGKSWWDIQRFRADEETAGLVLNDLKGVGLLAVVALLAGFIWRRVLLRRMPVRERALGVYDGFLLALRACFARFLPLIAPLATVSLALILLSGGYTDGVLIQFFVSATAALAVYVLIRSVLSPCAPASPHLTDSPEMSRSLLRTLSLSLLLVWLSYMLLATPVKGLVDTELLQLMRAGMLTALVLLISRIMWNIRKFSWAMLPGWMRLGIILILLLALLAEYLGYRNFSIYLIVGTIGSLLSLAVAMIAGRFTSDLFDQIDSGNQLWQLRLRKALRVKAGESVPGLMWMRLLAILSIWGGFAFAVLRSWGLSRQSELVLFESISQGFDVGSFHVVPSRILLAILIFSLVVSLSRLIKKKLARPWVQHTHLDRGAQDAAVTIFGYVGFVLAMLISLSVAGIEFKNIAVIAGALSVGIGFGLQNIVNNFVSGLILLFERPIRAGDWIEVGGTEGYVKSINIRSTEIQTFDRAEVIVPNSELISGQVTNWVLHDPVGRGRIPIGVAYGSDTEKVRDLLTRLVTEQAGVITDSHFIEPPKVLFREFGDSALNFEVRFFVRDVTRRLGIISEINFAIDKAFREAGIEIPFPQRDVHIRRD